MKFLCFSFTYRQPLPNVCNQKIVFSVTVNSPERTLIEYIRMLSSIYQHASNLIVSLPIRRGQDVFMKASVREHRALSD